MYLLPPVALRGDVFAADGRDLMRAAHWVKSPWLKREED